MRTIKELTSLFGIVDEDAKAIAMMKGPVADRLDDMIKEWYEWLSKMPEHDEFFDSQESIEHVQKLQHSFWMRFFKGNFDDDFFESRRRVGQVHARIGLPQGVYLAGVDKFLGLFVHMLEELDLDLDQYKACRRALNKLAHLDMMIIVQSYEEIVNKKIAAQTSSLMEMSTPVTQLWTGLLFLPIVGLIDSKRAQDIMNNSLVKISETNSQCFILDISGVAVVDTAVANHLIKITKAAKLMGCESIISGVSPNIAQTIVELGIDIGDISTTSDMKGALENAFRVLGKNIISK
jgi:rsbT co-antagonist protein RsbR